MRSTTGITLIELLIVIVLVGMLTVIAMPVYQNHSLRAQRSEARIALLRLHTAQERFYLRNGNRYTSDLTALGYILATDVPTEGGRYQLSVDPGADAIGYTARATATGRMSQDSECQQFTINAQGLQGATPDPHGRCW